MADYCRKTLREVEDKVKTIPLSQRRHVYYAEGPTGLETDPRGSAHSEAIDFVGGLNVAEVPSQVGMGQTPVSMEQVLAWNPQIVIAGYDHSSSPGVFYRTVWQDPVWQNVSAVKAHAVYEAPQFPFNWVDRPPSVNRIIGIKWLANRKLSDAELSKLLSQAVKTR